MGSRQRAIGCRLSAISYRPPIPVFSPSIGHWDLAIGHCSRAPLRPVARRCVLLRCVASCCTVLRFVAFCCGVLRVVGRLAPGPQSVSHLYTLCYANHYPSFGKICCTLRPFFSVAAGSRQWKAAVALPRPDPRTSPFRIPHSSFLSPRAAKRPGRKVVVHTRLPTCLPSPTTTVPQTGHFVKNKPRGTPPWRAARISRLVCRNQKSEARNPHPRTEPGFTGNSARGNQNPKRQPATRGPSLLLLRSTDDFAANRFGTGEAPPRKIVAATRSKPTATCPRVSRGRSGRRRFPGRWRRLWRGCGSGRC